MRNGLAYRVSLGGVISSLCVFFMFCSNLFPMLNYTIPTFAGFLMVVMIVETNAVWAFTTYASVSILSFLVTPNLEAALLFTLFMGYYPILRVYLQKVRNPALRWAIKLLVFNTAVFVFYMLFQYVFMTEDMLTECLLLEDLNQRIIYDTIEKLQTALRVSRIVTVESMENLYRIAAV